MQIYDQESRPLRDLIRDACSDQGSTLLVPDLQRPYVWSPTQVTLLVDSLLRGWPFGTLLLWHVRRDDVATIPSRPFWKVVDRTDEAFSDEQVSRGVPPASFRMVLDGQQRLQSLLLAFGGDGWGFRLLDREWSAALESERPKGRNARKHWSLGHLCLDLMAFREVWDRVGEVAKIEFREVLRWVVLEPQHGRSLFKKPVNYKNPLASSLDAEGSGRYLRLSRLWALAASRSVQSPRLYRPEVEALVGANEVEAGLAKELLEPVSELAFALSGVQDQRVSYLWLKEYNERDMTADAYNDAIVNIFTRLNSAGRALSKQEITFAWIKTGWEPARTEQRTAVQCFDDLGAALAEEGVWLDIDALVSAVSAMWSVLANQGEILTPQDLLRGEKVRPMAQDLVRRWKVVAANAIECATVLDERGLHLGMHYRSLNALTVLITWRLLARQWREDNPLGVLVGDGFDKTIDALFAGACDRWLLLSQWSGRWSRQNEKVFSDCVRELAEDWKQLRAESSHKAVVEILRRRLDGWIDALRPEATKQIGDLGVLTRDGVHQYYLPLWLWHRLDADRWKASSLSLRETKRGSLRLEVDHVVAVKLWGDLTEADADDAAAESDDRTTIVNSLGNCCLLEKSFNIAKSAKPLGTFLGAVHELKAGQWTVATWSAAIGLPAELVDPTGHPVESVEAAVRARTEEMKSELREYIAGTRDRADL